MTGGNTIFKFRAGQRELLRKCEDQRMIGFLARRQYGKTTTFSAIALKKTMKRVGHLVTYGSATLLLGRELILKEAAVFQRAVAQLREQAGQRAQIQVLDRQSGKAPDKLTDDDFASLFEAQRLEFRVWHDRTRFSRTQIIAPNPATAVGWTGDVMLDEVGRIRDFRGLWEAMEPIASSDPTFRILLCTTPPPDDTHFSFEMLGPPIGAEFKPNPAGTWYRSQMGVLVLRVDAWDAWADGVPVYDLEKGEPLPPAEHRQRSHDKDAWDRNYGVKFLIGGSAAVGLLDLDTAQRRGLDSCRFFIINDEEDFTAALDWLVSALGKNQVGIGVDLATTTNETSNPTAVAVCEKQGVELIFRAVMVWKTKEPKVAQFRLRKLVQAVNSRKEGGRARGLAIDATNERYFSQIVKNEHRAELPVELVIGSETIQLPGMEDPQTMKQYLGSQLCAVLSDNHTTLPADPYVKTDFRLVKKEKGQFVCTPDADGKHGDTFDSCKLAMRALTCSEPSQPKAFPRGGSRTEARKDRSVIA